jgi:phage tail sheath protein FI
MDLAEYDDNINRLFDDSTVKPDVNRTAEQFEGRAVDNNYVATYFPNVTITDTVNNRILEVPASVAVIAALAINDRFAYAWFAPAGFNRAALDFVKNVDVRLDTSDKNRLQDARINPIATFPRQGFVIFGQKTLQMAKSALDRVNVRRLMIEVKRAISEVAETIVFEQNTQETRNSFLSRVKPILATIQSNSGIEEFKVVMDETNNTDEDIETNKLNGRIVVVPTRAAEYIAIDFIITNSGVSFA